MWEKLLFCFSMNERESPEPSCVSMKSDQSMGVPFKFSSGDTDGR